MKRKRKGSKSCNAFIFWMTIITAINWGDVSVDKMHFRIYWCFLWQHCWYLLNMHIIRDFSCDKLRRMYKLSMCYLRPVNSWNWCVKKRLKCLEQWRICYSWFQLKGIWRQRERARTLSWSHTIILNYLIAWIQLKWAQHRDAGNLVHPLCFPPMTTSEINSNVFSLDYLFGTCIVSNVRPVRDSCQLEKPVHIAKSDWSMETNTIKIKKQHKLYRMINFQITHSNENSPISQCRHNILFCAPISHEWVIRIVFIEHGCWYET